MPGKALRIGVVMDPIDRINPKKDSTLAMLLAATRRHHDFFQAAARICNSRGRGLCCGGLDDGQCCKPWKHPRKRDSSDQARQPSLRAKVVTHVIRLALERHTKLEASFVDPVTRLSITPTTLQ